MNTMTISSYIIKNTRIDCEKDAYEILNYLIVKSLNDEIKIITNEDMFVYFMWNEDIRLIVKYSKSEDMNVFKFVSVNKTPTCILISGDLVFFAFIFGKVKMSGC